MDFLESNCSKILLPMNKTRMYFSENCSYTF
uniref:Uncharacterized protein n=1 Tax=Arundo donax TaxID=35708 RepID=A0A0A8YFS5_ARUDO